MRLVTGGEANSLASRYGEGAPEVRLRVADYMEQSPVVVSAPSVRISDGPPSATVIRSDGEWVWSQQGAGAFREGSVELDETFIAHVLAQAGRRTSLTDEELATAQALLSSHL
jgi:hypothetical protein